VVGGPRGPEEKSPEEKTKVVFLCDLCASVRNKKKSLTEAQGRPEQPEMKRGSAGSLRVLGDSARENYFAQTRGDRGGELIIEGFSAARRERKPGGGIPPDRHSRAHLCIYPVSKNQISGPYVQKNVP
jgi:hypothetical protein